MLKAAQLNNSPIADGVLYPHLKITDEKFPRLLATRRTKNDSADYFGAFLPATNLRIWMYQLNKIFRLRSCEIEIDGDFPQPCQMYFNKKCLAPCVAEFCGHAEYLENVEALRLFLSGDQSEFESYINRKINDSAENLEYEKAAKWRDVLQNSQALLNDKKLTVNLKNAVDIYSYEETENQIIVYLFTTRGRKFVGSKQFVFDKTGEFSIVEIFEVILREFYRFSVPREIRLPVFYPNRREMEKFLAQKTGGKVKISFHENDLNQTAQFRLKRTKLEYDLSNLGAKLSVDETKFALKTLLGLPKKPDVIECFDVAHISNQDFVAAACVWENGKLRPEKLRYWISDAANELQAMAFAVRERLKTSSPPDLIIADGGKSQLNIVIAEVEAANLKNISVISAVKPPRQHSEISHLLTADGRKIEFINRERVFEIVRELRDEAHRAANELYRQHRENKLIHRAEIPLITVRFDEIDGAAEDLRLIAGKVKSRES